MQAPGIRNIRNGDAGSFGSTQSRIEYDTVGVRKCGADPHKNPSVLFRKLELDALDGCQNGRGWISGRKLLLHRWG